MDSYLNAKLVKWTIDVDIKDAKAGDTCFFYDASRHVVKSLIKANDSKPNGIWVGKLDYMADGEDDKTNILDKDILRIERYGEYMPPNMPGLYFDANNALYYLSTEQVWHFLKEPHNTWRTQQDVTIVKLEDINPEWFPFAHATAVKDKQ